MVLKLNSFGLFRNQSFELGQITIFFGKNESGKTTIFDAIVSSLIRITGTTSYGKKIKDRYGESRNAQLTDKVLEIPASKFLNSYAIREGKVALDDETKETKDLVSSIQRSLFDSGYSLKNLKTICLERSSLKGNVKAGKDFNKASENYEAKHALWKKADEERKATLALWTDLPKKEKEKRDLSEELRQKEILIQSLEKQSRELAAKQKHSQAVNLYQKILIWESKKVTVESFQKRLISGNDKIIPRLDDEIRHLTSSLNEIQKNIQFHSETLSLIQKEIGDNTLQRETLIKHDGVLYEIEKKLDGIAFENAPKIEKVIWKKEVFIVGVFLLLLSIGLGLFVYVRNFTNIFYWLAGLFGFCGLTIVTNFSKTKILAIDEVKQSKEIEDLASELTLRTEGQVVPLLKSREGIRDAIGKIKQTIALVSQRVTDENTKLHMLIQKSSEAEKDQIKIKHDLESKEKEIAKLLNEFGVKTVSEFQEKLSDAKAEEQTFHQLNISLQTSCSDYSLKDISTLKVKVNDEIQSFASALVPPDFSAEENQKLKNLYLQIESETKRFHQLKEVYHAKETALSGLVGGSQVMIKDVLEKCDLLRKEMEEADSQKQSLVLNISAYQRLAEIFTEMDEGSENQMLGLVQSLSKRWNEILPEENLRKIEWNQLTETPKAYDEMNEMRSIDLLSTGTKELFYFSLRIEYALRMAEEDKLKWLLLDEPFRHMDPDRTDSAVKYLLAFIQREAWKGVFFTFDEALKNRIEKNAKDMNIQCILHDLNVK